MKYEALTTPFKIGNVEIRNRFVMLPMTIEKTDNYAIGDDLIDFYEQRAIGGAGLIEIGSCYVCDCFDTHPKYHTTTGACGVWDDCFIPGLTRTAEACHKHGAKLAAQLQLCYEWRPDGNTELLSYAPSKDVVSGPFVGMPEREFTIDEIKLVVKQYGEAAKRCQKAGIDIIEIHAGIGYMVMRFISKYSNHRTDEYGGSTENRCRLLTDIIDEIHRVCGEDYPILIRYSADDLMPGGQRLEDLKEVIEVVEKHGVTLGPSRQASMRLLVLLLTSSFLKVSSSTFLRLLSSTPSFLPSLVLVSTTSMFAKRSSKMVLAMLLVWHVTGSLSRKSA